MTETERIRLQSVMEDASHSHDWEPLQRPQLHTMSRTESIRRSMTMHGTRARLRSVEAHVSDVSLLSLLCPSTLPHCLHSLPSFPTSSSRTPLFPVLP